MQRTYQPTQASRNGLINRHAEFLSMASSSGGKKMEIDRVLTEIKTLRLDRVPYTHVFDKLRRSER
jgi:hypothetical protein